jgi:hypothetical protein
MADQDTMNYAFNRTAPILAAITAGVIYFVRSFDVFAHPQFWAEDGNVLWLQHYLYGPEAIFLPYAGYLHVLPGIAAVIAALFDPKFAPIIFAQLAAVFVAWAAFSAALAIPNAALGFFLGASLSVAPTPGGEIFGNLINLSWFLGPPLALILCSPIPSSRLRLANQTCFVVFAGLTGPFAAILLPVTAFRFAQTRHWLFGIALVIGIVILALVFLVPPNLQHVGAPDTLHLIRMVLMRCVQMNALGAIAAIAVISVSLYVRDGRRLRLGILFLAAAVVITTIGKFRYYSHAFDTPYNGPRYFFIPQLALIWCAISLWFSGNFPKLITTAALAVFLSLYPADYFWRTALPDQHWATYAEQVGKLDLVVPINPAGWSMNVPAKRP